MYLPSQKKIEQTYVDKDGVEPEVIEAVPFTDWLAENYKRFGTTLEFVTNKSQEGSQFVKGFGGIGGICRYQFEQASVDYDYLSDDDSDY